MLASAARLQAVVPDAVLVGGSAAALHAGHRESFDHDHVLPDLADRSEVAARVRAAVERSGLTDGQFASLVGTSASRLSTYLSAKVTPSAAMLVRIERAGSDLREELSG